MNENLQVDLDNLKNNQIQKIKPQTIAKAEAILAVALLYSAGTSSSLIPKVTCSLGAVYLAYGAYLNHQGRVRLLPPQG